MPAAHHGTDPAPQPAGGPTQNMSTSPEDRSPAFPSTQWSRILARHGPRDLEALAHAYWRPIHAYLASRLIRD